MAWRHARGALEDLFDLSRRALPNPSQLRAVVPKCLFFGF
jgi:hypothetical protein